jgi:ABC-type sugar transport system substrate-binding protein
MKFTCFFLIVFISWHTRAEKLDVTFVIPDGNGPLFWNLVASIAKAASDDLDVELETLNSDSDRFGSKLSIENILSRPQKPDYLIFRPFHGNAVEMFNMLEASKVPFITLEQAFVGEEAISIGVPGQKYSYWLGQINYDNQAGGQLLTEALVKLHFRKMPNKSMGITGIGGDFDAVSTSRQNYLASNFRQTHKIAVNQIFPMYWSPILVKERFAEIYMRYPETTAFWCAGDQMALEVIDQLKLLGSPLGESILIGGFDWLPQALKSIEAGEMTASVGGHFLMGAKAVLKIVDFHYGLKQFPANSPPEKFELIDHDNIKVYLPFINRAPWPEIDYRQFSATNTPQASPKPMTVKTLLEVYTQATN